MMENKEETAHLIDTEPVLFLGCNNAEIMALAGVGFITGLVLGILVAIITGIWMLILPFLILMPMIVMFFGGKKLGKAKEGKPVGYFNRLLKCRFAKHGIGKAFVIRSGYWGIRR